jgi:hypothetical protein
MAKIFKANNKSFFFLKKKKKKEGKRKIDQTINNKGNI